MEFGEHYSGNTNYSANSSNVSIYAPAAFIEQTVTTSINDGYVNIVITPPVANQEISALTWNPKTGDQITLTTNANANGEARISNVGIDGRHRYLTVKPYWNWKGVKNQEY